MRRCGAREPKEGCLLPALGRASAYRLCSVRNHRASLRAEDTRPRSRRHRRGRGWVVLGPPDPVRRRMAPDLLRCPPGVPRRCGSSARYWRVSSRTGSRRSGRERAPLLGPRRAGRRRYLRIVHRRAGRRPPRVSSPASVARERSPHVAPRTLGSRWRSLAVGLRPTRQRSATGRDS